MRGESRASFAELKDQLPEALTQGSQPPSGSQPPTAGGSTPGRATPGRAATGRR